MKISENELDDLCIRIVGRFISPLASDHHEYRDLVRQDILATLLKPVYCIGDKVFYQGNNMHIQGEQEIVEIGGYDQKTGTQFYVLSSGYCVKETDLYLGV